MLIDWCIVVDSLASHGWARTVSDVHKFESAESSLCLSRAKQLCCAQTVVAVRRLRIDVTSCETRPRALRNNCCPARVCSLSLRGGWTLPKANADYLRDHPSVTWSICNSYQNSSASACMFDVLIPAGFQALQLLCNMNPLMTYRIQLHDINMHSRQARVHIGDNSMI